jgi:hypothetical protein
VVSGQGVFFRPFFAAAPADRFFTEGLRSVELVLRARVRPCVGVLEATVSVSDWSSAGEACLECHLSVRRRPRSRVSGNEKGRTAAPGVGGGSGYAYVPVARCLDLREGYRTDWRRRSFCARISSPIQMSNVRAM